jgi:hypothetical protein
MLSLTASAVALLGLREAGQRQPGLEALLMGQALLLPLPPLLGWSGPVVQMAPWCLLAMQLCGVAAGLLWLRPRPVDAGWAAWWMHGRQVGLPALLCLSLGLDVLHAAWLLDCSLARARLPLQPRHVLLATPPTLRALQRRMDAYGDAYAVTLEQELQAQQSAAAALALGSGCTAWR